MPAEPVVTYSFNRIKIGAKRRVDQCIRDVQGRWPLSNRFLRNLDQALLRQYQLTGPTYAQVLVVFKRSYLRDQIKALLTQSVLPTTLFIYQNECHVSTVPCNRLARLQSVRLTQNVSWNSYYHGRFYVALLSLESKVIVWDDDIIPGSHWNEYSIQKSNQYQNAIVTANGRLLQLAHSDSSECSNELRADDPLFAGCDVSDTLVDYGGHSWTLPRSALNAMASYHPASLANSEDFHISAAAYIKHGTLTIMPAQSCSNRDTCAEDYLYGARAWDRHASYLSKGESSWQTERITVINYWITHHLYKPVALR